jgi:hypothetical protein
MSYSNPSLFIILPRGTQIYKSDVEREIDAKDYGEIKQVSIQTTKLGDKNAVVHFERWFRSSDDVIKRLFGGFVNIKTRDFGVWRATVYVIRSPNVSVRSPVAQSPNVAIRKPKKQEPRRPRSPIMTDESEIPADILEFIDNCRISEKPRLVEVMVEDRAYHVPIAPCLSAPSPPVLPVRHPDDMELEEGEILSL